MKIAINCCYYGRTSGGIKEYIYNLVTNVTKIDKRNEYLFYISPDDELFWQETIPKELNYKIFPFYRHEKVKRALLQKAFWQKEYTDEKFDVFHSPFFHVPNIHGCKLIMTVHDLRFRRYPQSYTFSRRIFIYFAFKRSLNYVDHIITVSEFTKNEILKYYKYNKKRITHIHEAIDFTRYNSTKELESDSLTKFDLTPKKYVLTVGHLEPRKNYPLLIDAWDKFNEESNLKLKLVIVGKRNYKYSDIIDKINKSNTVTYLDFVSFKDLLTLYKFAKLFIFPSLYEGFGFPPLEAAVFKVPSVVSNVASIPEICGKGAVYFDPLNRNDIINKLRFLLNEKSNYNKYVNLAKENLHRFDWKENAKQTIEIYSKV